MESQNSEISEPNSKCELAKINLVDHLSDRMAQLCMSDIYSDVILIVEDQRIPAHRCILAAGNKHFHDLLYGSFKESEQKEVPLHDTPLGAFKELLRFIYSGQICLLDMDENTVLDTLILANKYGFTKLEHAIVEYLKQIIAVSNAWLIFQTAWLCELEELKEVCYTFIDRNASNLLAHELFKQLSKKLLEDVLRRDSFLASEFEIFTAVIEWCKHHEDVDVDAVLSYVRFPLMTLNELSLVRKSGIVKLEKLVDFIEEKSAPKKLPYRVWAGINMATFQLGAKIIRGSWEGDPPPGNIFPYGPEDTIATAAIIKMHNYQGIVVQLGSTSVINYIQIRLWGDYRYSYFLEVSTNQTQWERVIDYRDCRCRGLQSLYFPPKSVKYIKIVGTSGTAFCMTALKASYTEIFPKQVNGFIAVTIEICGTPEEGGVEQKTALIDDVNIGYYRHNHSHSPLNIYLNQPYLVGSLRIFFSNNAQYYDYSIEVSTNNHDWWTVATKTRQNAQSWQNISFPPCPVVSIKISSDRIFTSCRNHYIHFENIEEAKSGNWQL